MRIAEVLLRPAIGGAESLVDSLRRHWDAEGHDVAVVYVDEAGTPRGKLARVQRLTAVFRAFQPDVVHAHSALPNLYARLASRGRWPTVTVLHSAGRDFDTHTLRIAERALARWTAHVIAVSPGQVDEYRRRVGGRMPITVVPNGVRSDIVARTSASAGMRRAVAVGRLDPQKRIDLMIDGWQRAALPGACLQIAGVASDGVTQEKIERSAKGVPGVSLLGSISDVPGLLADSDLFVHAASEEAHPLAPIEAACAGLPIVVTDEVAHQLPAGLPAVTFAGGDAGALAVALSTAHQTYDQIAGRAVTHAAGVAAEFSITRCADRHMHILRDSAASRAPGAARKDRDARYRPVG